MIWIYLALGVSLDTLGAFFSKKYVEEGSLTMLGLFGLAWVAMGIVWLMLYDMAHWQS